MKPYRIGLIGGMGPLAGVELHRLVIEATPAAVDQDHLQVVLFTNPHIPDRTTSLREDDGQAFVREIIHSAHALERLDVDVIALGCMTAHSRLERIQAAVATPILNGIKLTGRYLHDHHAGSRVALLATNGSVKSGIYTSASPMVNWLLPPPPLQAEIHASIYEGIKAGDLEAGTTRLTHAMHRLQALGATAFVLGCTELGLLHDQLSSTGFTVIDPMRILAARLVYGATHASKVLDNSTLTLPHIPRNVGA